MWLHWGGWIEKKPRNPSEATHWVFARENGNGNQAMMVKME